LRLLRALLPDLVLSLAALVDVDLRETFHSTVAELAERLQDEGFTFALSGPWPPYNFCTAEDGEPVAEDAELVRQGEA
ncbi:MAG TPA: GvpL/GvpF family gas vesicle protein, partial [Thermoanaerobaculia bacterium]|nr:GvpL/GvpF family gas vesicle protein [Thermoanaerobaculia bacterium]